LLKKAYINFSVNHYFEANRVDELEAIYPAYTLVNAGIGNTMNWKKAKISFNLSVS